MRPNKWMCGAAGAVFLVAIQGCREDRQDALPDETVAWFQDACYEKSGARPDNPELLVRVAQLQADPSAWAKYLQALEGMTKADSRSRAWVAVAGYMYDQKSASILRDLALGAEDPIRWEAVFALWKRHDSLSAATVAKVLEQSADARVRGTVIGLASSLDMDNIDIYKKALADADVGVRAIVFDRAPPDWWMRRMAKEWFRQRIAGAESVQQIKVPGDINACLRYLEGAYGIKETAGLMRGGAYQWARRVLETADQIDSFTDQVQISVESGSPALVR